MDELKNIISELELLQIRLEIERKKANNIDDKIDLFNAVCSISQAVVSIKETF